MDNVKAINQTEERATFIVKSNNLEKMKGIAYWERTLQKDEINNALEEYVHAYEKKHGEIQPIPKRGETSKAA